tara:strand:- start:1098 stop:1247 length:150 start_codon:yes stop_codon:yes gene_type:complete
MTNNTKLDLLILKAILKCSDDKDNNKDDVPLVETGYLDPKHLPEGHPDK